MEVDSPWKEILEDLFEPFLLFFFPQIHCDLDFSQGHEFLDQELQQIIKDSETGKRIVDKLVKVYLKDGSEKWLLIHIEIQGYAQEEFPERMYVYNYRIFDKFRRTVISLALLTDENSNFRPDEYRYSRWGFELLCRYPLIKLIDYRACGAELEASPNPFAIAVSAYLKTLETQGDVQATYTGKKQFLLELYRRNLSRETILALYKFIDWIMTLPQELEASLHEEVRTTEEKNAMPHITTAERVGIEKGIEKSLGTVQQALETILEIKFGLPAQRLNENIAQIRSLETLQALMQQLKQTQSLSEAEALFAHVGAQVH